MTHGFDVDSSLICEGIVGDGCGGGRLFMIKEDKLIAYDPQTKEEIVLLGDIEMAKSISKQGCIVSVVCQEQNIEFDLSALKKVQGV